MNETATVVSMKKQEEDNRLMGLAEAQERFVSQWGPTNSRDAQDFRMELNYLVHKIYAEAQGPALKQLTEFAMRTPMAPFFVMSK